MCECRICGNSSGNKEYSAREMMLGTRDSFDYFQCAACGCLQISEYPADLARYYPSSYYSFSTAQRRPPTMKAYLQNQRDRYWVFGHGALGRLVALAKPESTFQMFSGLGATPKTKVLDVGCGAGQFLLTMRQLGFEDLTGADPFLPEVVSPHQEIRLLKADLDQLDGRYGLITLHHSFEHMPRQQEQMRHLSRVLADDGTCMLRIPVCSSFAWEKYGTNWASLDAPRHLYLHTQRSVELLAGEAGLEVFRVAYDSGGFQFWASELYTRDISQAEAQNLEAPPFTHREYSEFEKQARALNAAGRGDAAAFFLRKRPGTKAAVRPS